MIFCTINTQNIKIYYASFYVEKMFQIEKVKLMNEKLVFHASYANFGTLFTFITLSTSLFTFHVGQKYLAGIIVLAILLAIALVIIAYFIYQNRRFKSLKANPENRNNETNVSKDIYEIPAKDDGNYEQVENEQSTYTALKSPGQRDDDNHVYCHLNEVQTSNVNQKETGI